MIGDLTDEEVLALAQKAGRRIASKYPATDADDIAGEALGELYRKAGKLAETSSGYVYRVLERAGARWAAKQRYEEQVRTSQYVYTALDVRTLLENAFFNPEAWDVPTSRDSNADWIETGTIGISLIDMQLAFERLTAGQKDLLIRRFFHHEDVEDRKAVSRAVARLTVGMNKLIFAHAREASGRRARSNHAAQALTSAESEHESRRHGADGLRVLQRERQQEKSDPPGTHFDWDKYR